MNKSMDDLVAGFGCVPAVRRREPTSERFLADVENHQMTVAHEDGIYRHLRFKSSKCGWNQWFDLVTWPGFLTICGDMGTWTFARVPDMFAFFRSSRGLEINASYWAEKLCRGTHDGRDGAKVWDDDLFRDRVLERLEDHDLTDEQKVFVRERFKEEIFSQSGEHFLLHAAYEFHSCLDPECIELGFCCNHEKHRRHHFQFDSCELPDGKDYAFHFIWCLYAIVWGIQQYDALQQGTAHAPDGAGASNLSLNSGDSKTIL